MVFFIDEGGQDFSRRRCLALSLPLPFAVKYIRYFDFLPELQTTHSMKPKKQSNRELNVLSGFSLRGVWDYHGDGDIEKRLTLAIRSHSLAKAMTRDLTVLDSSCVA